jgi:hypothetical protein
LEFKENSIPDAKGAKVTQKTQKRKEGIKQKELRPVFFVFVLKKPRLAGLFTGSYELKLQR